MFLLYARNRTGQPRSPGWSARLAFNDSEQLEVFAPESYEGIKTSHEILAKRRVELIATRNKEHATINAEIENEENRWFAKDIVDSRLNYHERIKEIDRQLARLRRYLRIINGDPIPKGAITSDLIQAAKEVPIETIFNQDFRRSGSRLVGLCPFHNEKSGSFFVYTGTNRCYCFGCGAKGNVIDTYIKLHGCSFNEAVLALTGGGV